MYFNYDISIYDEVFELLEKHEIPERFPEDDKKDDFPFLFGPPTLGMTSLMIRDKYIHQCGFCFLSKNWIEPLAAWIGSRRCLEIMCGSGALSKCLSDYGVNIRATDNHSWEDRYNWFQNTWTAVEQLDCLEAIEKYGDEVDLIICSWPYMDDTCYKALLAMRAKNPNAMMIYIGEREGEACANTDFFESLEFVEDPDFYKAVQNYRAAFTVHDFPSLVK